MVQNAQNNDFFKTFSAKLREAIRAEREKQTQAQSHSIFDADALEKIREQIEQHKSDNK